MLEKFEKWIIEKKEKINAKTMGITIFVIFGICIMLALQMANMYKRAKQQVVDDNNNTLYELIGYIKNVDILVEKARVETSQQMQTVTYADILRQANLAKAMLAKLPVNQNSMQSVSKFLVQVADFSYSNIKQLSNNQLLTDATHSSLQVINSYANKLDEALSDIYTELVSENVKWDEVSKLSNEKLNKEELSMWLKGVSDIDKTFTDYEGLIYDGAYSSHLEQDNPKYLSKNTVEVEEATYIAKQAVEYMKNDIEIFNIAYLGEIEGNVTLYQFEITLKNQQNTVYVQITKNDGRIYQMIYDRKVSKEGLSQEELEKIALKYLENVGYTNLKATYYLNNNGMCTINFAAYENDIVMYPDLIKIKLAKDDGQVCSIEAKGYIFNHTIRDNLSYKISMQQAKDVLYKQIEVNYQGLAIIANEAKQEILTYEFKGVIEEREYDIYINAQTGVEEKLFVIIETPGGKLAM